jgi:DNA polymerase-1
MFFKALAELQPTHVAVTFDRPEPTFRKKLFPAYQAQREEKPDDLYAQIPMIKDVLAEFGVPVYEVAGFEADDAIGTIVAKTQNPKPEQARFGTGSERRTQNARIVVLTGDKDLLQLVREGVEVVLLRRGMTDTMRYDRAAVIERFGFPPERIPDFKALAGDPSDNYPGVPGVGEKIAAALVKEFGGAEDILKNAERRTPNQSKLGSGRAPNAELPKLLTEKLAAKILQHMKELELGLKLATIVRDVPVAFDLAACALKPYDRDAVVAKLREFGFTSLLGRLPTPAHSPSQAGTHLVLADGKTPDVDVGGKTSGVEEARRAGKTPDVEEPTPGVEEPAIEVLTDPPLIRHALADARAAKAVSLAVVADEDDPKHGHPRALGVAYAVDEFTNAHESTKTDIRDIGVHSRIRSPLRALGIHPWGLALSEAAALLRDPSVQKDVHDAKALLHALGRSRVEFAGLRADTELLSYLLAPGSRSHDLEHVMFAELGIESTVNSQQSIDSAHGAAERAAREASIVAQLVPILTAKVRDAGLAHVYEDIERLLVPVLYRMEAHGVQLDTNHLAALGKRMRKELDTADRAIYRHAGEEFNVDSPQQLKRILFEKLGLAVRGIKKTVKGKTLSTAASELEKLRGAHPIIEHLFTHRELSKLLSTYVEALPALVDPTTGRVHTTYHQTVTATGRLSSSDPNLQNIPVTEPWGPAIRRAFVAEEGWRLLSLDYSQFELRVAAALSGDRNLQKAFRLKRDIHAATGAEIFGVAPEEVTRDQRRVAKAINFGILYGMGATSLAATAGISREEAEEYIRRYFQAYGELHDWVEATKALARKRGYVETLFGRKRFLPEIASGVPQVRAAAERMAVNMPIQGTQADLLKMAMIQADGWMRQQAADSRQQKAGRVRMVLTVHDELVFEVRERFVDEAAKALTDILEHVHQLPVPIVVEAKVGLNWADMERVD